MMEDKHMRIYSWLYSKYPPSRTLAKPDSCTIPQPIPFTLKYTPNSKSLKQCFPVPLSLSCFSKEIAFISVVRIPRQNEFSSS